MKQCQNDEKTLLARRVLASNKSTFFKLKSAREKKKGEKLHLKGPFQCYCTSEKGRRKGTLWLLVGVGVLTVVMSK